MAETSFTPGPWRVAGPVGHGIFVASEDQQIAVVYGSSVNASGPANAYLSAAAPDLYSALRWCVNHLDLIAKRDFPDSDEKGRRFNSTSAGLAALAKARGEQ
jgi:hypothetical protein